MLSYAYMEKRCEGSALRVAGLFRAGAELYREARRVFISPTPLFLFPHMDVMYLLLL